MSAAIVCLVLFLLGGLCVIAAVVLWLVGAVVDLVLPRRRPRTRTERELAELHRELDNLRALAQEVYAGGEGPALFEEVERIAGIVVPIERARRKKIPLKRDPAPAE